MIAIAGLVYYALDKADWDFDKKPRQQPKAFVPPPPVKKADPPDAPELKPGRPLPTEFPWDKKQEK
jgi:hypothetical protein